MKCFPILGSAAVMLGALLTTPSVWAYGDLAKLAPNLGPEFFLLSAQGYLGVYLGDVDSEHANALPAKDAHAAEVMMVDHDAPTIGKSGLQVHDVILLLDGEPFDNVAQLRHRLHDMPPGRNVKLLVLRDGAQVPLTVQLCDRALLEQRAWLKHFRVPEPVPAAGSSFLGAAPSGPSRFLDSMLPRGLYIGAEVNPVRAQLAGYFGVKSGIGLLVESVDSQSPAARAGLKAGDVVVQVASKSMTSRNDWSKAMRMHRGQLVQVTVMRDKQEQVLTMSAGRVRRD